MSKRLEALALRVEDDPAFLGSVLHKYAVGRGLEPAELADELSCPVETLAPLALCLRPRAERADFRRDIDRIAARFDVAADALTMMVRHVDAIEAFQSAASGEKGLLMAARDADSDSKNVDESIEKL